MHKAQCLVTCTIQIGATGAVSSFVGATVQSVTRNGTGLYTIKLQPNTQFSALYFASGSAQSASGGLSGVLGIEIQNAPDASAQTASGASLQIKTLDAAGALVDPASGSAVNVMMIFANSKGKP